MITFGARRKHNMAKVNVPKVDTARNNDAALAAVLLPVRRKRKHVDDVGRARAFFQNNSFYLIILRI